MVNQNRMDDFGPGDWVGIDYRLPDGTIIPIPGTIINKGNRNPNPLKDYIEISLFSPKFRGRGITIEDTAIDTFPSLKLYRQNIEKIWRSVEAYY